MVLKTLRGSKKQGIASDERVVFIPTGRREVGEAGQNSPERCMGVRTGAIIDIRVTKEDIIERCVIEACSAYPLLGHTLTAVRPLAE